LSLLGISLGIGAIIAFTAVGRGFRDSLDRYMRQSGAQLLVVNRQAMAPEFSRVSKEGMDFVRSLPEVEQLSPGTFTIASPRGLKIKTKAKMLFVFGRIPGDRPVEKFRSRVSGRLFEREDELILGADAARDLGLKAGDTLELLGRSFTVVGIYSSDVKFEAAGCVVATSVIQRELGMGDAASLAFVYLRKGADWRRVRSAVEEKFETLEAIRTDEFTSYYNQLEYIDWFVWIVSLVSVAVGGLGVLNTMLMAVSERTREIGTLRAVGWSQGQILRLVLAEGVLLSALGGILGLGAGSLGAEVLIHWAPRGLDTRYTVGLFVEGLVVALALGFLGALYPAWKASRLSPIEALKYE
jgi:putative ABC transport system permease protein